MAALNKIRSKGFAVTLVGGFIEISPAGKLADTQREYIRQHKAEIMAELQAEAANEPALSSDEIQPGDSRHFCHQCIHHRSIPGKIQIIHCLAQDRRWLDDWPRNCQDFESNGAPVPANVRWQPEAKDSKPVQPQTEYPKPVTVWSPAGNPVTVIAKSTEHESQLKRWNSKQPSDDTDKSPTAPRS